MKIQIPDDFDPEKIIRSGQCFRASAQPDGSFHFITGKNTLSLSPAWNGYLGSGLHPLRMEAGVGSLF